MFFSSRFQLNSLFHQLNSLFKKIMIIGYILSQKNATQYFNIYVLLLFFVIYEFLGICSNFSLKNFCFFLISVV